MAVVVVITDRRTLLSLCPYRSFLSAYAYYRIIMNARNTRRRRRRRKQTLATDVTRDNGRFSLLPDRRRYCTVKNKPITDAQIEGGGPPLRFPFFFFFNFY